MERLIQFEFEQLRSEGFSGETKQDNDNTFGITEPATTPKAEKIKRVEHVEEILREDDSRYVMFPIKHNDVWKMYKNQIDSFWRVEEIDLSKDLGDWDRLTKDEQQFQ